MFHQKMMLINCDFIKHFFVLSESIVTQKEWLAKQMQWRVHRRRPIVMKLCGDWCVQLSDCLRWCTDVVQALAIWSQLMHDEFECTTSDRLDLSSILSTVCKLV
jgi:hypothetical protein